MSCRNPLSRPRANTARGCGDEALDLGWVCLDLFAQEDGVTVADRRQGADDSLDRLFDRGAFEARVGQAGGGVCERLLAQIIRAGDERRRGHRSCWP